MRPTAVRSNQASVHYPRPSLISTSSVAPSVYHQQQQQQQILYAPISNPMVTLQPCGTTLHPSCVYPSVQSHIGSPNSIPLHLQGKNNRWHSKNKPFRGQQYYQQQPQQQQQQQQQVSYNPKPVVFYDQSSSNIAPIPPSTTSFLVASSTFAHAGSLPPSEHYNNNTAVTHLLPQPFNFKPPDVQPFCVIQDRQNVQQQQQQQQQHQHPMQASYYNISATNTCSLQTVNANSSFPLSNLGPYSNLTTFSNNQFPASVSSPSVFSTPSVGVIFGPSPTDKPTLEFSSLKHNANKISSTCESRAVPISHNEGSNSWPPQIETRTSKDTYDIEGTDDRSIASTDRILEKPASAVARTDEEHYSDESSTSFDFTIEAEKMVSALCNTTSSNDLGKEESKPGNKTDSTPLFSGAGDNKASWFTEFCSEYETGTSIGVQTDNSYTDRSQYPELIRKTVYWGCTEAEIVLDSDDSQTDYKQSWLTCLSSATRMAITKSSTCIPVFAGDRVFVKDLINALLRISNGWLSLDNYMNKQHFPNLLDRLDPELSTCFHVWEESTYELLKQIVQTFRKFGEDDEIKDQKRNTTCRSSSFPGDVALYTNYDLLIQLPTNSFLQQNGKSISEENSHSATSIPLSTNRLRNFQYNSSQQEEQSAANQKESKLRSKWTITDNLSPAISITKSVPNVSTCHTDSSSLIGNKLRARTTSRKLDSAQKSLNAEFCQLRNKVMESNAEMMTDKKQELENKLSVPLNNVNTQLQHPTPINYSGLYAQNCLSLTFPSSSHPNPSYPTTNPGILTYGGLGYSSSTYPVADLHPRVTKLPEQLYGIKPANINSIYVDRSQADQIELPAMPRNKVTLLSQIEPRTFDKQSEEMASNLSAWFASIRNAQFPATTSTFEEARVNENSAPRLFTQQEMSKYSGGIVKQPQFDSNRQFQALQNLPNIQSTPWAAGNFVGHRFQVQQTPEEYDSSEDVRVYMKPGSYNVPKKRHQRRSNRRSDSNATSRNAHASNHHANACSNKGKNITILASSTPLSHTNLPLSTNISNGTLIKSSFPSALQLPTPRFNLENSPRILKRTESLSQNARQDVTWKAACASAEILLEALHVKDCDDTCNKIDCNNSVKRDDKKGEKNAETLLTRSQRSDSKSMKRDDCILSYEASEDDSESTYRLSPSKSIISISQSYEDENALTTKTNVKTDSWLIRTLNNASIVDKSKKRRKNNDTDGLNSVSSNSSETIDAKADHSTLSPTAETKISMTIVDSQYPTIFSCESDFVPFSSNEETSTKEVEGHVGRATYSETVRRSMKPSSAHLGKKETYKSSAINPSMTTILPLPDHKGQKRDPEQSYQLLQKSQKWAAKKAMRKAEGNDTQVEDGLSAKACNVKPSNVTRATSSSTTKTHGKRKDLEHAESKHANKSGDRGWSVWYSSRRKQSISPLALSKLEMIHQTVWQMDEAKIFKDPFLHNVQDNSVSVSAGTMEEHSKAAKGPMFLEIVDYKLKNRIYHKVEHAIKDFRRVIHSARLYHQQDDERMKKIDALSRKLEDLLEEHFGNWDFDSVIGSLREDSPVPLRFKASGQKTIMGLRCDGTKKSASSSVNAESSLH